MQRDSLDFGTMDIPYLFRKMFIPTLLGLLLSATINVADGIFVGHGVGADALAAVNIVAPLFMITAGLGLMFGSGASIAASVHLSQGRGKAADIIITQGLTVSTLVILLMAAFIYADMDTVARWLGSSEHLLPLVREYLKFVIPACLFSTVLEIGLFIVRLDGSPNFAMMCTSVPSILNLLFDWIFIFPLDMGLAGAAIASSLAQVIGLVMFLVYIFRFTKTLHLYKPKFTRTSILLTLRNTWYIIKLGASLLLGELALSFMIIIGNHVFMKYVGEAGVAAFSVACYCFPIVFMIGNAIAQSAQPIISYNMGASRMDRSNKAFRLAFGVAAVWGILIALVGHFFPGILVGMFLSSDVPAYAEAIYGIPYFAEGFLFFTLNVVCIGYFQSIEKFKAAILFMTLRGFIFMSIAFFVLPGLLGVKGIWLADPFSEVITFITIAIFYLFNHTRKK